MNRRSKGHGASKQTTAAVRPSPASARVSVPSSRGPLIFAALLGAFFGLCLLKFSNPAIMEKYVEAPKSTFELLASTPWPIHWAYWILGGVALIAIPMSRWSGPSRTSPLRPDSPAARSSSLSPLTCSLPLLWLVWQVLATHFSIRHDLSNPTLVYYTACIVCFYLGLFFLGGVENLWPFWLGILTAFVLVIAVGLDQHFGGLAESRAYFYAQQKLYPDKLIAPEFLKKIASHRIYSTLFYPNTLAGALLLFSPAVLLAALQSADRWRLGNASRAETIAVLLVAFLICILLYLLNTHAGWIFVLLFAVSLVFPVPRWVAPAVLTIGILAVLFWSGSKAGWLIMLLMAVIAFLRFPFARGAKQVPADTTTQHAPRNTQHATANTQQPIRNMPLAPRLLLISLLLIAGLTGFFVRYSTFFRTGATSVSARFDYWRAAVKVTRTHPLLGTGPGTFQVPYEQIKNPNAEMTRLVHNDYLEQASNSGIPGSILYTFFIASALVLTWRRAASSTPDFLIWLGVCAWAAQCLVEFSLYIPALAWPAFCLLGYLCSAPPLRKH